MKYRGAETGTTAPPDAGRMVNQILGLLHDQPGGAAFRPETPQGTSRIVEVYSRNIDDGRQVGISVFTLPRVSPTGRRPVRGVEFIVTENGVVSTATVRGRKKLSKRGEIREGASRQVSAPVDEAVLPKVLSRYVAPLDAVISQVAQRRDISVDRYGITGEAQQEAEDVASINGEALRLLDLSSRDATVSTDSLMEWEGAEMAAGQTTSPVRFVSVEHEELVVYRTSGMRGGSIGITIQPLDLEPLIYRLRKGHVEQFDRMKKRWLPSSQRIRHALAEKLHNYDSENLIAA